MIEAIFFPDKLPESFTILSNGNERYTSKPTRKYNFLGLAPSARYSETSFTVTTDSKTLDFCVIGWYFNNEHLQEAIIDTKSYICNYFTSDGKPIGLLYKNGMNLWNNM